MIAAMAELEPTHPIADPSPELQARTPRDDGVARREVGEPIVPVQQVRIGGNAGVRVLHQGGPTQIVQASTVDPTAHMVQVAPDTAERARAAFAAGRFEESAALMLGVFDAARVYTQPEAQPAAAKKK